MMKKLIPILSAVILLLAACSKKETTDVKPPLSVQNATAADLAGTWHAVDDTVTTTTNGKTTIAVSPVTDGTTWQFKSDGTGVDISSAPTINFTFSVSGGIINLQTVASSSTAALNYDLILVVINAKTLVLRVVSGNSDIDLYFNKQ